MPEATGDLSREISKAGEPIKTNPDVAPAQEVRVEKTTEQIEAAKRQEAARIAEVGGELTSHAARQDAKPAKNPLFGDFQNSQLTPDGKVALPVEIMGPLMEKVAIHKQKHRFDFPSYMKGHKTATEYDSKAVNFSTRTAILTTDDGRRVFAVYDYRTSFIHRAIDRFSRRLEGAKMGKVKMKDWKQTYESRSNIPVIENPDNDIILMPYIPNANAKDVLANNKEVGNFGPVPWAKDLDLEGKIQLGEKIVDALAEIHSKRRSHAETILPNMIITPQGQPILVDPENLYYPGVELPEQKGRDLRDVVYSISGALAKSEGVTDFGSITNRLLARYPDQGIVEETQRVAAQKPGFIQRQFIKFGETMRLGIGYKDHGKVTQAILAYKSEATSEKTPQAKPPQTTANPSL